MNKSLFLGISIAALVAVNVAALAYIGVWALFVLGSSYPLAEKILEIIREEPK
jgi:hypothetical protein